MKLARAYTGRELVAVCADHAFFSSDDWFIGTTEQSSGIPAAVSRLSVKFPYGDGDALAKVFDQYPGQIACVIMEAETHTSPKPGYLARVKQLCEERGALWILDEMITGFRWHNGGAQKVHEVVPHLSTFGKAMGNGFAIAALVGKREYMRLGGLDHDRERVFLLSTTHGGETHSLAAAIETMRIYSQEPVIETLYRQGERLRTLVNASIASLGLQGYFEVIGQPCNLVFATRDAERKPSQMFRTLFLQEMIQRGILAPSFVVSYSHGNDDIDRTATAAGEALKVYAQALDGGAERFLRGRPVKPVNRRYN